MIKVRLLNDEKSLPLVVEPEDDAERGANAASLIGWLTANRESFDSWLLKHGALLFRGFKIDGSAEFEAVTLAITPELMNYVGGDSPRKRVSEKVYTSTEYPESYQISLHNEMSYAHKWPRKIFFYCAVAPQSGGETPIVDCREVFRALDPQIRDRFIAKKVRYLSNAHGGYGMGKSWQAIFETTDRSWVEDYLKAGGVSFHWDADGGLHTSQVREAVVTHPVTGEQAWFNQAEQWHPSAILDQDKRRALASVGMKEEEMPHYASFGDGSPLDDEELGKIRALMHERAVFFPWQEGDLLVLDNVLVAHGRNSFKSPRKILVAMA
jgi:alpha-ketoglutarate-dependent taurine dioxygenase